MQQNQTPKYLLLVGLMAATFGIAIFVSSPLQNTQTVTSPPPNYPWQSTPPSQPSPPVQPPSYTLDDAINSIKSDVIKKNLYYLASDELEGRMSGKKGNVLAAKWLKEEFEKLGLQCEYQRFRISRMNPGPNNERGDDFTNNVIAWLPGNDPILRDEIVVVGAHLDHIGYGPRMSRWGGGKIHPGADDNASGTCGLLEIARACSMMKGKNKRTVVFQAYSAEEMGLIGSRYYVNNPTFPKGNPDIRKHIFMLNLDMVGYLGKGRYFAGFYSGDSSADIGRIINELNTKYRFAKRITSRGSGGSDHANFYNKKVPIAFLHTGGHPHYHTPTDTADKINYDGVEQVSRYGFELTWKVIQSDSAPRFNHAQFKAMSTIHDHGHPDAPFWRHSWDHDHKHPHTHPHDH